MGNAELIQEARRWNDIIGNPLARGNMSAHDLSNAVVAIEEALTALAAADKRVEEAKAEAWDEALEYVRGEIRKDADFNKAQIGIPNLTNRHIQPCFDAINATGSMTYHQYNAHIAYVQLSSMEEWFTVHPERSDGEGGVFEADDDPNPYRTTKGEPRD